MQPQVYETKLPQSVQMLLVVAIASYLEAITWQGEQVPVMITDPLSRSHMLSLAAGTCLFYPVSWKITL